jgi:acyl-CoA thioesterase 8
MPPGIPSPDACRLVEDSIAEYLKAPGLTDELRMLIDENMTERKMSPIAIKDTPSFRSADGVLTQAFWMRAKAIPKYELPFQKVESSASS